MKDMYREVLWLGMAILLAGSDIRRISNPTSLDLGTEFDPRDSPVPDPR
jgi:hypothetical protein